MAEYTRGFFAEEKWASDLGTLIHEMARGRGTQNTQQVGSRSADHPQMGARLAFPTGGRRRARRRRRPDRAPRSFCRVAGTRA